MRTFSRPSFQLGPVPATFPGRWLHPQAPPIRHTLGSLAVILSVLCLPLLPARADLWCTAYYPGWEQGSMPASTIDFTVVTHLIHFSIVPNANGTLNSSANSMSAANSLDAVSHAHAAGRKALVCVGGADSQLGFQGATSSANRSGFISNLVNVMTARGYDGLDLDWEPLEEADAPQFTNFVKELRIALDAIVPRPLLTAALASPPTPTALVASVQDLFDQVNLMTYDLSGAYPGWVTWFNAPIYDGGYRFPSTSGLVPSAEGMIAGLINAGVPAAKLGLGIAFYGWIWSGGGGTTTGGVSAPRQAWATVPATSQASYNSIMATYYQTNIYRWDTNAQAAYLTIDNAGSNNDKFISYDDQRTCQSKVSYARNRRLGGVMIWELAQDHQANQPDPLLQAVKQALATPGPAGIRRAGLDFDLSFASAPLGAYRIQWASNLPAGAWNTLTVTNVTDIGGVVHVTDSNALAQPQRFYRIQTPP